MARSNSSSGPALAAASSVNASWGAPASCLQRRPRALVGSAFGVERQRRGALEERGGRCQPAARTRTRGRLLQLVGDVLVGPDGGVRPMPGPAIRIELGIGGGRQRPMRGAPLLDRRRAVDR